MSMAVVWLELMVFVHAQLCKNLTQAYCRGHPWIVSTNWQDVWWAHIWLTPSKMLSYYWTFAWWNSQHLSSLTCTRSIINTSRCIVNVLENFPGFQRTKKIWCTSYQPILLQKLVHDRLFQRQWRHNTRQLMNVTLWRLQTWMRTIELEVPSESNFLQSPTSCTWQFLVLKWC